jgi:hypothetical protein
MLETRRLLAERAQTLVRSLNRAIEELDAKTFAFLAGAVETGKNGLIAFGRAFHPVILLTGGVDAALTLGGDPNAETLRATLLYLHNNAHAIFAFAASDPQLTAWLSWLIESISKQGDSE